MMETTRPRDLLDVARERRERLLMEIAELERFITAGEALRASEETEAPEENAAAGAGTAAEAFAGAAGELGIEAEDKARAGESGAAIDGEVLASQEPAKRTKPKGSGGRAAASTRRSKARSEGKKSSGSEAPARRSRDEIVANARALTGFLRQLLLEASGPVPTSTLLERVTAAGHRIGGRKPLATLAAKLSRSSEFNNASREGWTLADQSRSGDAGSGAQDAPSAAAAGEPRPEVVEGDAGVEPNSGTDAESSEGR